MKKLLLMLVLFLLCIVNVNALTDKFYMEEWIDNIYLKKVNSKIISYEKARFMKKKSDGALVYCIEPFKYMSEEEKYNGYTEDYAKKLGISEATWNKITLIAYYGYGYGNHTQDKWYPVTQIMIWREIDKNADFYFTDTLNGNKITSYDDEIKEINTLVKNHNKLPSFANKDYNFSIKSNNILTDSNNVLNGFTIESSSNKLDIKKEQNNLYINTTDEISSSIIFKKDFTKYNKVPIIFIDSEYQNIMAPGKINSINFSIDIEVMSGNIEITKLDFDTNTVKPQGEGILIGSTYAIYDHLGNIVDTLAIDDTNTAKSKGLGFGKYTIKEIKSMKGYYLDENSYDVVIDENNLMQSLKLKNKVIKSKIQIYKYYDDKLEEGVKFEIYNNKGELIDTVTTDKEGKIEKTLPYGKYLFHQLNSIKNYKCVDDFTVIVDSNSKEIQTLNLYDERFSSKVKIYKRDSKTGEIINDFVSFKIFDILQNDYLVIDGKSELKTENGILIIDELAAGEYFLEEIESPNGYVLNTEKIYFSIDDENIFSYDEENNPVFELQVMNDKEKIIIEVPDTNQDINHRFLFLIDDNKNYKIIKKRN